MASYHGNMAFFFSLHIILESDVFISRISRRVFLLLLLLGETSNEERHGNDEDQLGTENNCIRNDQKLKCVSFYVIDDFIRTTALIRFCLFATELLCSGWKIGNTVVSAAFEHFRDGFELFAFRFVFVWSGFIYRYL